MEYQERIPQECEEIICSFYGTEWRNLNLGELNGAFGIAIVYSVLSTIPPKLKNVAYFLGIDIEELRAAFTLLSLNGVFLNNRVLNDSKALRSRNKWAWGYYAGLACGATGLRLSLFS